MIAIDEDLLDEAYLLAVSIRADECRDSFYQFFLEFFAEVVPAKLELNWNLKYLCNSLQNHYMSWHDGGSPGDLGINVPPGTLKSTIVTVMFPVWTWLKRQSNRLITCSYASGLSLDHAVKSRDLILSPKFKEFYPGLIQLKSDQNNKGLYENRQRGRRLSTSVGATVTGFHADIIIVDDPINPQMAFSDTTRKNANYWLEQTLSNRKTDKKRSFTIIVMQRLHDEDPIGVKLEKKIPFKHICLPAELTDLDNVRPKKLSLLYKGGLLDPGRMTPEVLQKEKTVLGSVGYAGQYLQSPKSATGNLFKREWIKYYRELPKTRRFRTVCSWDTAYKIKQENDFSVCTVWAEYETGFYLIGFFHGKLEYTELKNQIQLMAVEFKPNVILIEDKASGQSAIQELKRLNLPIYPVSPDKDKILRANQITPTFEAGNIYFPFSEYINLIIDQLTGFPTTKHDDIVDSITQFINWARGRTAGIPVIASAKHAKSKSNILKGYR